MNACHVERSETSLDVCWQTASPDDLRLKAWPRGLRPLRCSFASLRMTIMKSLLDINSHRHCPGDILPTGALPEFSTSQIIVGHQDKSAHDANPA